MQIKTKTCAHTSEAVLHTHIHTHTFIEPPPRPHHILLWPFTSQLQDIGGPLRWKFLTLVNDVVLTAPHGEQGRFISVKGDGIRVVFTYRVWLTDLLALHM